MAVEVRFTGALIEPQSGVLEFRTSVVMDLVSFHLLYLIPLLFLVQIVQNITNHNRFKALSSTKSKETYYNRFKY